MFRLLTAHFHEVDGDLFNHYIGKIFWIVQNSENNPVTSCSNHDLVGITPSLLLYSVLGSNATCPLSRRYHDKMTFESLLNQFKSEDSFLGRRTYHDK